MCGYPTTLGASLDKGAEEECRRERRRGSDQNHLLLRARERHVNAAPVSQQLSHRLPRVGAHKRYNDEGLLPALVPVDGVDLDVGPNVLDGV